MFIELLYKVYLENNIINSKANELIELFTKVKSILINLDIILDIKFKFSFRI